MYYVLALAASLLFFGHLNAQQTYPLDQQLTSAFGGKCSLEMTCKVTKVGDMYVYLYSIKNKGNKPIKVKWDTVSKAMYFGNSIDIMLDLEPDENAVFTLEHPDPPLQVYEQVTAFYLTTNEEVVKLVKGTPELPKGMRVEISKKSVYNSESGTGYGALPKSWVMPNPRR